MSDSSRRLSIVVKEEGAEVPEISQQDIRNTRQEEGVISPPLPGEALLRDDDKNIPAVNTIVILETVKQLFRASITEVLLGDAAVNSDNHYYYTAITVLVVCSICLTLLLLYYNCFTQYLHRPANPTTDRADTTNSNSSTVLHNIVVHKLQKRSKKHYQGRVQRGTYAPLRSTTEASCTSTPPTTTSTVQGTLQCLLLKCLCYPYKTYFL